MKVDLEFTCRVAELKPVNYKQMTVQAEDADIPAVLEHIPLSEVVDYYKDNALLDEIGVDRVKKYFNLKDSEEE